MGRNFKLEEKSFSPTYTHPLLDSKYFPTGKKGVKAKKLGKNTERIQQHKNFKKTIESVLKIKITFKIIFGLTFFVTKHSMWAHLYLA